MLLNRSTATLALRWTLVLLGLLALLASTIQSNLASVHLFLSLGWPLAVVTVAAAVAETTVAVHEELETG